MQNTGTYTLEALVNYVENGTLHMTPGPTEVNATCQCRDYPPAEEAQISIDDLMRESLQDIGTILYLDYFNRSEADKPLRNSGATHVACTY